MIDFGARNESNRAAWLKKALREIPEGSRILDAGAGERQYEKFCSHLNYVAQDFGKYDGKGNGVGLQKGEWDQGKLDIISDIVAIPEPDQSFDAIMCIEVFEHLSNPIEAIREFSRLLRPGGRLIITAPFCSLTHFAPYHFYTGFNRYFYEHHLTLHGFDLMEFQPNGNYFEYLGQELQRLSSVAARYCGSGVKFQQRILVRLVASMMAKLSARGGESSELLCFGYHVKARKH